MPYTFHLLVLNYPTSNLDGDGEVSAAEMKSLVSAYSVDAAKLVSSGVDFATDEAEAFDDDVAADELHLSEKSLMSSIIVDGA